jgi:hypothetical protein
LRQSSLAKTAAVYAAMSSRCGIGTLADIRGLLLASGSTPPLVSVASSARVAVR